MKAVTQRRYGGPDMLVYQDIEVPVPKDDEVLIEVKASSVNAADWLLMHGRPRMVRLGFGLRGPKSVVPGRDTAGVVVAVGHQVREFAIGDEVYGEATAGSFAQYTSCSAKRLALKPRNLSFEAAATVPLAGTTALQGLRDVGKVGAGTRVLINGGSGGVGSFAVQIAKSLGAEVTAVCSSRNLDRAKSLGADNVIDYAAADFADGTRTYDFIFDLAGNRSLRDCRRALSPRGTLILASGAGGPTIGPVGRMLRGLMMGLVLRQRIRPLAAAARASTLVDLREMIESGSVAPSIERIYPLSETADALGHFGEQHARGKIAISMNKGASE